MPSLPVDVCSLYRQCLRQTRKLPHPYLQLFFRLKFSDDIRSLARAFNRPEMFKTRAKRVAKCLRKIKKANSGHAKSFTSVLDLAYGRTGKLRWELLQHLLDDASSAKKGRFAAPSYSPELKVLFTSSASRTTKVLNQKALTSPPILPARVDPQSQEARLFGTLNKRREANIRWRYFNTELGKVLPPLELIENKDGEISSHTSDSIVRKFGFTGIMMQDEIARIVGPLRMEEPKPGGETQTNGENCSPVSTRHPSRWLRRRYQELLGRIPILTYVYSRSESKDHKHSGFYQATLSPNALSASLRLSPTRLGEVDAMSALWLAGIDNKMTKNHIPVKRCHT